MTKQMQRELVPLVVTASVSRDIIQTVQSWNFHRRPDPTTRTFTYLTASGLGLVGAALTFLVAWYYFFPAAAAVALALYLPRRARSKKDAAQTVRVIGCTSEFSGELAHDRRNFARLYKVQQEVHAYIAANTVADLHRERFNNLTLQANEVYSALLTGGLQPREDKLMLDRAHPLATDLANKFDTLYEDLLRQAELDPHVSQYGQLLENMRNLELRTRDSEEKDYQALNTNYKRMIEGTNTDPREYYRS